MCNADCIKREPCKSHCLSVCGENSIGIFNSIPQITENIHYTYGPITEAYECGFPEEYVLHDE